MLLADDGQLIQKLLRLAPAPPSVNQYSTPRAMRALNGDRSSVVATRKKKSLVIVESPAKAKTINKYLGPGYEVVASKGHVRDLVRSRMGIDIEGGWIPTYRDLKDRKELLTQIKKQASAADIVYLAP